MTKPSSSNIAIPSLNKIVRATIAIFGTLYIAACEQTETDVSNGIKGYALLTGEVCTSIPEEVCTSTPKEVCTSIPKEVCTSTPKEALEKILATSKRKSETTAKLSNSVNSLIQKFNKLWNTNKPFTKGSLSRKQRKFRNEFLELTKEAEAQLQTFNLHNQHKEFFKNLLSIGCHIENKEFVEIAIQFGADVNEHFDGQQPPITIASINGNVPILEMLTDAGANLKLDFNGPPLHLAIYHQNLGAIDFLIKQPGIDLDQAYKYDGTTPLTTAVTNEDIETTRKLLECGVDINKRTDRGGSAIYIATYLGNEELINLLLEYNPDVNKQDNRGKSPLMQAATNGRPHIVEKLLNAGARPNDKDKKGKTALDYAQSTLEDPKRLHNYDPSSEDPRTSRRYKKVIQLLKNGPGHEEN